MLIPYTLLGSILLNTFYVLLGLVPRGGGSRPRKQVPIPCDAHKRLVIARFWLKSGRDKLFEQWDKTKAPKSFAAILPVLQTNKSQHQHFGDTWCGKHLESNLLYKAVKKYENQTGRRYDGTSQSFDSVAWKLVYIRVIIVIWIAVGTYTIRQ